MNTLDVLKELLTQVAPVTFHVSETKPAPYIHLIQLPGVPTGRSWESIDRIQVDIYAEGYDPAQDLASEASKLLTGNAETSFGLVDQLEAEIPFWHEAIESDTINKFSATYLVTYRL